MRFQGILFNDPDHSAREQAPAMPAFFGDMNLDQIVAAVTADKAEYELEGFFYHALRDIDAIHYRHEDFADLDNPTLFEQITETQELATELDRIKYNIAIKGGRVTVAQYADEPDYCRR